MLANVYMSYGATALVVHTSVGHGLRVHLCNKTILAVASILPIRMRLTRSNGPTAMQASVCGEAGGYHSFQAHPGWHQ